MDSEKLTKAKEIIKENLVDCGIFNSRNILGDEMTNIYYEDGLSIDVCCDYGYFEVIGLSDEEFNKLEEYYDSLLNEENK